MPFILSFRTIWMFAGCGPASWAKISLKRKTLPSHRSPIAITLQFVLVAAFFTILPWETEIIQVTGLACNACSLIHYIWIDIIFKCYCYYVCYTFHNILFWLINITKVSIYFVFSKQYLTIVNLMLVFIIILNRKDVTKKGGIITSHHSDTLVSFS